MLQNGQRHPYKIDTAYLRKRNVFKPETEADGKDPNPFDISVYTLKELIWRDWREEWEPRPTIPGSIRLIFFGRLLDDKVVLRGMFAAFSRFRRCGRSGVLVGQDADEAVTCRCQTKPQSTEYYTHLGQAPRSDR